MVVAELVERLLPTPEVLGSNPVICLLSTVLKKNKERKRGQEWPIKTVNRK